MTGKKIRIALLGLGTVGYGVYRVLLSQREEMEAKIGCEIEIAKVLVRNIKKASSKVEDPGILTDRFEEILEDDTISIVAELMGGIEPASSYIRQAILRGRHIVTANKDLLAEQAGELLAMAQEKGVSFLFEAAVAGGIPIIRPLQNCLLGNKITEVMGIVNGTTNFILTRMAEDGMEYKEALYQAMELGYAEADPTADVNGLDAGRKVAILASEAFHSAVTFRDVHVEGMAMITAKDIRYAREMGRKIKLLGVARDTGEGIEAYVCPMLIPITHPLASVNDSFNAVFVHGDAVGDCMFFGRGAGDLPTASAVVGDLFETVRRIMSGQTRRTGKIYYQKKPVKAMEETFGRYYLRLHVEDRCGVLAEMTEIFARYEVSVAQIIQKESQIPNGAEVAVITARVREGDFMTAIDELSNRDSVLKISRLLRVYG